MTDEITYHVDPNVIKYISDKVHDDFYYLGLGKEIPSGADLNNYTTPGVYEIPYGTSVSNKPTSNSTTARLVVKENASGITQEFSFIFPSNSDTGGYKFSRYLSSDGWRDWVCVSGVDAIIAEGTSGNWTYWKFANGLAFLRYHEDSKTREWTQDTSINGGIYYNKEVSTPFAIKNATAFGSGSSSRYTWVGISGNSSSSNGGNNANFMWFRSARSISFTDELNATVIATWK